eukprot:scaffold4045_cov105-Skeletonema_dohrnii-CCMP3373.AAC.8
MGRGKVFRGIVPPHCHCRVPGPGANRHNLGCIEWNNGRIKRQPWTCHIDRNAEIVLQKGFIQ